MRAETPRLCIKTCVGFARTYITTMECDLDVDFVKPLGFLVGSSSTLLIAFSAECTARTHDALSPPGTTL